MVDAFPLQADASDAKALPFERLCSRVILRDTIIFPEGGYQPSDIGYISVGSGATLGVLGQSASQDMSCIPSDFRP